MPNVVILGGGVGGLAAAHELVNIRDRQQHNKSLNIVVVEANQEAGGQARSAYVQRIDPSNGENYSVHSEYCWHAVGSNYRNFLALMREINVGGMSCEQMLVPIRHYYTTRNNGVIMHEIINTFLSSGNIFTAWNKCATMKHRLSFNDLWRLADIYLRAALFSSARIESQYDDTLWKSYCAGLSDEAKRWLVDSPGIFLGMDVDKLNVHTMLDLAGKYITDATINKVNGNSDHIFWSFCGPMNTIVFNPYVEYLRNRGVTFLFNTSAVALNAFGGRIESVDVMRNLEDSVDNPIMTLNGQYFVNSLPVESFAKLVNRPEMTELAERSRQLQTQVAIYLDKQLDTLGESVVMMPDTPWCLMLRQESRVWRMPVDSRGVFKDLLSVGIGIVSRIGTNGKTFLECSVQEVIDEVWAQMNADSGMRVFLDGAQMLHAEIFECFYDDNGRISTHELKFSNNVGTLKLRPHCTDREYTNLFHGGAWTRTTTNIFNMESAAEAGRKAAQEIMKKMNINVESTPTSMTHVVNVLRYFDKTLYKCGLRNPFEYISPTLTIVTATLTLTAVSGMAISFYVR